jgi:hypothetical protein
MSRELAVATDAQAMAAAAVRHVCAVFQSTAVVLIADARGGLSPMSPEPASPDELTSKDKDKDARSPMPAFDLEFAREVVARGERCIKDAIYLPLQGSRRVRGVIVVCPQPATRVLPTEQLNLLDAFAAQLALSLQRARLAEAAEAARISAERALLRNTLLASISHDLRTPLAAIAGAGSLIAQPEYALNVDRRTTLGNLIERKARDMSQLLTNVLELMRMEFGSGTLRTDWHAIDDLVALALRTNEARLARCGSISEACGESSKSIPVVRNTFSPNSASATGSSSISRLRPATKSESAGGVRRGLRGPIPPPTAEGLKESHGIAVAGSLRLHPADQRLLIGGLRAEQSQIVDIAYLHLPARKVVSHFRGLFSIHLGGKSIGIG